MRHRFETYMSNTHENAEVSSCDPTTEPWCQQFRRGSIRVSVVDVSDNIRGDYCDGVARVVTDSTPLSLTELLIPDP